MHTDREHHAGADQHGRVSPLCPRHERQPAETDQDDRDLGDDHYRKQQAPIAEGGRIDPRRPVREILFDPLVHALRAPVSRLNPLSSWRIV